MPSCEKSCSFPLHITSSLTRWLYTLCLLNISDVIFPSQSMKCQTISVSHMSAVVSQRRREILKKRYLPHGGWRDPQWCFYYERGGGALAQLNTAALLVVFWQIHISSLGRKEAGEWKAGAAHEASCCKRGDPKTLWMYNAAAFFTKMPSGLQETSLCSLTVRSRARLQEGLD